MQKKKAKTQFADIFYPHLKLKNYRIQEQRSSNMMTSVAPRRKSA